MSKIDLKKQSPVELKALAYDLSNVVQQYTQMLQLVNQEIQLRAEQEATSANKIPPPGLVAEDITESPKPTAKKGKVVKLSEPA